MNEKKNWNQKSNKDKKCMRWISKMLWPDSFIHSFVASQESAAMAGYAHRSCAADALCIVFFDVFQSCVSWTLYVLYRSVIRKIKWKKLHWKSQQQQQQQTSKFFENKKKKKKGKNFWCVLCKRKATIYIEKKSKIITKIKLNN